MSLETMNLLDSESQRLYLLIYNEYPIMRSGRSRGSSFLIFTLLQTIECDISKELIRTRDDEEQGKQEYISKLLD